MGDDGLHLLLVDDDEVDRAQIRRLLHPSHSVCEAATAAEGQDCLTEEDPDLVLLDYRLPDADGTDLLTWFTKQGLPVVMLTGVEDAEVIVEAMQRGADDYLVKGRMDAVAIDRAIRGAVERAALRQAVAEQQAQLAEQAAALDVKHREVRELASALTLAEQAERSRVAALLHDHVQQLLFGAQMMVQSLGATPEAAPLKDRVTRIHDALRLCIEATRKLTLDLTPPVLDEEDYSVALCWLATHVQEMYGLDVEVIAEDAVVIESREVRVLLTELVRELLFNAVKHAETESARVRLAATGEAVTVVVEDEGRGFDPAAQPTDGGFGLYSVRGRLELFGGTFSIDSAAGAGTRVRLTVPLVTPENAPHRSVPYAKSTA